MTEINKPSGLSGNELWASSGTITSPSPSKYALGWVVEAPPYQYFNYTFNKFDVAFAHINQHGIPVWDSATEYQGGKSRAMGSDGKIYFCHTTNTNNDPVSDLSETYWNLELDGSRILPYDDVSSFVRINILSQTDPNNILNALGGTTTGKALFKAASASSGRTTLGATTIGSAVFTASDYAAAKTAIGLTTASETSEGIVERATDAEAISGTDDVRYLTPKKLKLGFSVSLGTNGYIKFPSWLAGITFQWGTAIVAVNSQTTITGQFDNACLNVFAGLGLNGSTYDEQLPPFGDPVGKNIRLINPDDQDSSLIRYFAIGY